MSVDILGLLPPFGTEAPDNSTIQFMSEQRTVLEYWDSRPFKIEMNNFASSVEWGGEAYGPAKWHQWELMLQFPATHTGTQIMKKGFTPKGALPEILEGTGPNPVPKRGFGNSFQPAIDAPRRANDNRVSNGNRCALPELPRRLHCPNYQDIFSTATLALLFAAQVMIMSKHGDFTKIIQKTPR
ncbi:hypothetical protein NC652_011772 [Populus alba x Populus x berolinensis]|nr:hypothetical protein NC652_011772 [Populus alba x Populus x berolinensis]